MDLACPPDDGLRGRWTSGKAEAYVCGVSHYSYSFFRLFIRSLVCRGVIFTSSAFPEYQSSLVHRIFLCVFLFTFTPTTTMLTSLSNVVSRDLLDSTSVLAILTALAQASTSLPGSPEGHAPAPSIATAVAKRMACGGLFRGRLLGYIPG